MQPSPNPKENRSPAASTPTSPAAPLSGEFDGVVAVPATPFTAQGELDEASLRRYARNVLAEGARGFLAPAVAGEVGQITDDERERIVAILLEEAAGRVPVIGGATAPDREGRLRHASRLIAAGCHGVLAYIPFSNENDYTREVHALQDLSPGFLMIQDLDLGEAPLPVPLIARLHREVPCFKWIKVETHDRCPKMTAIQEATGGSLRLGTAGPDLIELLDRGVHSYLSTFTTGVYARIWQDHRGGKRDQAIALYRRLLPCLAFMATHQPVQWRFTKALLQAQGVFSTTHIRIPAPELDPVEARLVRELATYARDLSIAVARETPAG